VACVITLRQVSCVQAVEFQPRCCLRLLMRGNGAQPPNESRWACTFWATLVGYQVLPCGQADCAGW